MLRSIATVRHVLFAALLAATLPPQDRVDAKEAGSARATSELEAAIDRAVAPWVEARDFLGVVAVACDDRPPIVRSFRPQDEKGTDGATFDQTHLDGSSVFHIGSISKQFTAALILLLEEEGLLATSDSLARHLPDYPGAADIELHQLLTHTAGIGDVYSIAGWDGGRDRTLDELVEALGRLPRTQEPGAGFAYSNGGYALLAAVAERVTGERYGDLVSTKLVEPLGLERTRHGDPGPAQRLQGFDPSGIDGLTPAEPPGIPFTTGSGSIWSSASDLLAWNRALHGGGLLSAGSYAKMTTDHGHGYGYGLSVFTRFGRSALGHDGRVEGFASDLAYYPGEDCSVAVLSQVQSVARDEVRRAVAAVLFGEEMPAAESRAYSTSPDVDLEALVGSYAFGPYLTVDVIERDGRLLAQANEGSFSELVPLESGAWFSRMLYATVRFEGNDSDHASALLWGAGDGAPRGPRVEP